MKRSLKTKIFDLIGAGPGTGPSETFMVPMRDGTRLCTEVHLPSGRGPWPVILYRTPYGKNRIRGVAKYSKHGYAVIIQDARGRFESEGKDLAAVNEGWGRLQDGYDTVEWIAQQAWCNGKVGGAGTCYDGAAQNRAMCARPPHLVCSYTSFAASSLYGQSVYVGGAFAKALVEVLFTKNAWHSDNLETWRAHPNYDDYWKSLDCELVYPQVVAPMMQKGGWYDAYSQGTLNSFMILQERGGPGARGKQRLVMGPWRHDRAHKTRQGDLTYPANSTLSETEHTLRWFDYWLKGVENGLMKEPPVAYYAMGAAGEAAAPGNEWRAADSWPPSCRETPYFLRAGDLLSAEPPAGDEPPQTFAYDPANPVPTRGGGNIYIASGPLDQRCLESRTDVLVFTTAALPRPMEVTGRVKFILWASSSAIDTDFTAKLSDVYPDGRSLLVLDGIIRARHRESLEREDFIERGKVYRFEIDLWSTSLIFNKGHRIRVAVSSSNYPRFDANPNTGRQSWDETAPVTAMNTIFHDARRPSHILLPLRS